MDRFKKVVIRMLMSILFVAALASTFHSITGVEVKSMADAIYENMRKDMSPLYFHPLNMASPVLNVAVKTDLQVSLDESKNSDVPDLESAFDWTKYPNKKVIATGYTAGYESTGKKPGHPEFGITYSGVKVKRDLYSTVAADLDIFPIGTILFIPGYGYGVVADKGGAIKGNRVDLYYESVNDVYNEWGKKELDVYIVEMGDGTLTESDLTLLNEAEPMQVFRQQFINPERK